MKNVFVFVFILVCVSALAQTKKDTVELLDFKFRWFGPYPQDTSWLKNVKPIPKKKAIGEF